MPDEELRRLLAEDAAHCDAIAERLDKRFDEIAEMFALLEENWTREIAETRSEMRRGFAETQAMLKFGTRS